MRREKKYIDAICTGNLNVVKKYPDLHGIWDNLDLDFAIKNKHSDIVVFLIDQSKVINNIKQHHMVDPYDVLIINKIKSKFTDYQFNVESIRSNTTLNKLVTSGDKNSIITALDIFSASYLNG